jgi:hypothetical protein
VTWPKDQGGRFFQSLRLVKASEPSAGDYFEIIDSLDLWSLLNKRTLQTNMEEKTIKEALRKSERVTTY